MVCIEFGCPPILACAISPFLYRAKLVLLYHWSFYRFYPSKLQLFLERRSVLDVTQVATQHGAAPKRRRIESGWGMLGDAIAHHEKGLAIPW